MKTTFVDALKIAWVLVNAFALSVTIGVRIIGWQIWDVIPPSVEKLQIVADRAPKERLASLWLECDQAVLGAEGMIRLMETVWALTLILNIALVVAYYVKTRPRP